METRVQLQPAYVLHRRPFQNSSLLVDFFCLDYGLVRAVARGARRDKSRYRPYLQPFQPLLVSFTGRGEVKTVTGVDSGLGAIRLEGERLFSGLYLNELLTRLLMNHVEHTDLYKSYQDTLLALQGESAIEPTLRRFELTLLSELGYGINLDTDCRSQQPITADGEYHFTPDIGFERAREGVGEPPASQSPRRFRGADLVALRQLDLSEEESSRAAKRLLRLALNAHLGDKPLHSRNLFS